MEKNVNVLECAYCVLFNGLLILTFSSLTAAPESIYPILPLYSIRSAGQNEAREQVGLTQHTNITSDKNMYGTFAITPAFNRSFSPGHLALPLFGRDLQAGNITTLTSSTPSVIGISGSDIVLRNDKDWLADYFFFPRTFNSSVSFEPRIQNLLVDVDFFFGMDAWARGLFMRITSPICWSEWDLNPCPQTPFSLNQSFDTFSALNFQALTHFFDYFCLETAPTSTLITIEPLKNAKICGDCQHRRAGFADVHIDIGWNFLMHGDYHLGFFARAVAPTGNRPHGKKFFEPLIGNGHRPELGGGFDSQVTLWRSAFLDNYHLDLLVHADITHMFKTRGTCVFDLCNKPFSRYMIAGKITGPNSVSTIAPLANLTRCAITISPTTQADIVAMLTFSADYFDWNIGYNFWGTGCQTIRPDIHTTTCDDCVFNKESWALVAFQTQENTLQALNNLGDIHHAIPDSPENPLTPLTTSDINYHAADQRGLSNKFFTHLSFSWYDHERWIPYIGAGAEVEFGKHDTVGTKSDRCFTQNGCSCATCRPCALYQWGVWVKGGFSF
jgi:hypothetical protein